MTTAPTDSAITETADAVGIRSSALCGPLTYQPEIWPVEKNTIYAAIPAVESGLEYARECLATHEIALGRTTLKNQTWAETMEKDIRHMERTLEMLRACSQNAEPQSPNPSSNGDLVGLNESACSRCAYVKRHSDLPYFAGERKGTPEPQPAWIWTDRPWECAPLSIEFAEWLINVPLREEPGIHAVICPPNA